MRDQTTYLATETIRSLREQRGLTQRSLAEAIGVTDKAISKWESGRGLPDIALIDPIARALGISAAELLTGDVRTNENRAGNMLRSVFHVCPICGNIVFSLGEGSFSCCGSTLIPCEAEEPDEGHALHVERLDGEWYVTLEHPMAKTHFISFIAYVNADGARIKKLYPEQGPEARFRIESPGRIYAYCNIHGLFMVKTSKAVRTLQAQTGGAVLPA